MPLLNLHILHPPELRLAGIERWLGETSGILATLVAWDGCKIRRAEYDLQAGFDVATQVGFIRQAPGPVLLVERVQARAFERLSSLIRRNASIYRITVSCAEDLWQACEEARQAYEDGEPRITLREVVAYLILCKLAKAGCWGGAHGYMWPEDIPKGGFPKDLVDSRLVNETADALLRAGILIPHEKGGGSVKLGLASSQVVQPILDNKSFDTCPAMESYFRRNVKLVTIRLIEGFHGI